MSRSSRPRADRADRALAGHTTHSPCASQRPPNVYYKRKATGGVMVSATCKLENITEKDVQQVLHEYRIHSAEVLFREDCTVDQFIDLVEGNRKYVRCLYIYNKIDMTSIEEWAVAEDGKGLEVAGRVAALCCGS